MGAKIRAYEDRLCPAGAAGLSPAFQRREYPMKEFVLKGRKIGGRYRGRILYRIPVCLATPAGRVVVMGRFPELKRRAEIGVGTKVCFAPPSEPDWHISCIRLSSWWLAFKKIGVPQRALVLRRTSPPRRSRYLAIGSDLFLIDQPKPSPPSIPVSRAANMRSVQTVGSTQAHRARISPPC